MTIRTGTLNWAFIFFSVLLFVFASGAANAQTPIEPDICDIAPELCGGGTAPNTPGTPSISDAPGGVNSDGSYTVSWNVPSGAFEFILQERINGGNWTGIPLTFGAVGHNFSGKSVANYQYRVKACGLFTGCSSFSNTATVSVINPVPPNTPAPPTFSGLSHSSSNGDNNGAFTVNWVAPGGGPTSYKLQRRVNGGGWSTYTYTSISKSQSLNDGTYDFRVAACNDYGCSSYSGVRTVYVAKTPGTPSSISLSSVDTNGGLDVSWGSSSGSVDDYRLYRETNGSGSWGHVVTRSPSNRSYDQSPLSNGNYRYRVRACNKTGSYTSCSSYRTSSTTEVSPFTIGITAPANAGSDFTITWRSLSGYGFDNKVITENGPMGSVSYPISSSASSLNITGRIDGTYSYTLNASNITCTTEYELGVEITICLPSDMHSSSSAQVNVDTPIIEPNPNIEASSAVQKLPFSTNVDYTGHFHIGVPINVPQGVNGLQPNLRLAYKTDRSVDYTSPFKESPFGIMGYGWSLLGIDYIAKVNTKYMLNGVTPLFFDGTYYYPENQPSVRISTETDSATGDTWFKMQASGRTVKLGKTSDSRMVDNQDQPNYWFVEEVTDAFGNQMNIEYFTVGSPQQSSYGLYPRAFNYDGYRTEFVYGNRVDPNINGNFNFVINRIKSFTNGTAVGEYRLHYEDVSNTTRLKRLQYCGYNEGGSSHYCTQATTFNWLDLPIDSGTNKVIPMVVDRIIDGFGVLTEVDYAHEADSNYLSNYLFDEEPFVSQAPNYAEDEITQSQITNSGVATWMVGAVTRTNPNGMQVSTDYAYNNIAGRTSAMRQKLPDGTYLYTGTMGNTALYESMKGRPTNTERYTAKFDASGSTLLSKSYQHWAGNQVDYGGGNVSYSPYVCSSTTFNVGSQGNIGDGVQTQFTPTYTGAGLVTSSEKVVVTGSINDTPPERLFEYGEYGIPVINTPNCNLQWTQPSTGAQTTLAHTNVSKTVTTTSFDNNTSSWLIGFADSETTTIKTIPFSAPATVVTVDRVQEPGTLQAKTITEMAGTNSEFTTSINYNSNGTVASTTVSGANVPARTQIFSNYLDSRYPRQVTNALGHVTTLEYDRRFGVVDRVTDPNGQSVNISHGVFGRALYTTTESNGSTQSVLTDFCSGNCPSVQGVNTYFTTTTQLTNSSESYKGAPTVITYHDRLGRVLRTQTQGFNGQQHKVDVVYDDLGRRFKQSLPFTGSQPSSGDFTVFAYDVRGRKVQITSPDGSVTTNDYDDLGNGTNVVTTNTIIGPGGARPDQERFEQYNILGQLYRAVDAYGTSDAVETDYRYDHLGNNAWVQVNNDSDTVVTTEVDIDSNQQTITDPNTGTTTVVNDALGQVLTQTDANNRVTQYTYDKLGRVTQRIDDLGGEHIVNTFTFDTRPNGKGYLASRQSPGFTENTYYNNRSEANQVNTSINVNGFSDTFTTSFTYDNYGRVTSQTHPSGLVTHNDYNSHGYAYRLRDDNNKALSQINTTNPFGQVTQNTLGNGLVTNRTYDSETGQLESINTGNGSIQDNTYEWWSNGTLHSRNKGTVGVTETFTYDALNRLRQAASTGGSSRTLNYTYDKLGNLLTKTSNVGGDIDLTGYTYTGDNKPHRLNSVYVGTVEHTFTYDNVGNITFDNDTSGSTNDRRITYNSFNKPTEIKKGPNSNPSAQENIWYGPDGFRFYKQAQPSGNETIYLYGGSFEVNLITTGSIKRVEKSYLGDVIHYRTIDVNNIDAERYEYVHTDHLGSVEMITGENQLPAMTKGFDPFGSYRNASWTGGAPPPSTIAQLLGTTRGFTGHEQMDEVGLIHMNGRVYDPQIGRFMSADPIVQAPTHSQSYNRYAYVWNSPLGNTDPSGYCSTGSLISEGSATGCSVVWERAGINNRPPPQGDGADYEELLSRMMGSLMFVQRTEFPEGVRYRINWIRYGGNTYSSSSSINMFLEASGISASSEQIAKELLGDLNLDSIGNLEASVRNSYTDNGQQVASDLINAGGLFSSAAVLNFISDDGQLWKGKNRKWNRIGWGGNQRTGARSEFLRRAGKIKMAGQGLFFLGTGLSLVEGASAYSNGNTFGVVKAGSDIGWGAAATFGGGVGLVGGVSYFGASALIGIPLVEKITVQPLTDTLCFVSGTC